MNREIEETRDLQAADERAVRTLYHDLMECWNDRNAHGFAALFIDEGYTVGFDGSMLVGPVELESTLGQIFADHPTASYISKVRAVLFPTPETALLRAVAGMVPRGGTEINPAVNAVQSLVAARRDGRWRIVLFQNTPAAYHGRPQASEELTEELRRELRASSQGTSADGAQAG